MQTHAPAEPDGLPGDDRLVPVRVPAGHVVLPGDLGLPPSPTGVVLFAHGSGSSRHSPRNRAVAAGLRAGGLATLLLDLLTAEEEEIDLRTRHLRFDIPMLAARLGAVAAWLESGEMTRDLPIGCFGASTGGGAALIAAADHPDRIRAVVSRGGRPDLAGDALARVHAPTLLIVGGLDTPVIAMNEEAIKRMPEETEVRLEIVPGASHLFEEPGAMARVAELARDWFVEWL